MRKSGEAGFFLMFIAGILGILISIFYTFFGAGPFYGNQVVMFMALVSGILILFAFLVRIGRRRVFSFGGLIFSLLLLVSVYEWVAGILGVVGSIASLRMCRKN